MFLMSTHRGFLGIHEGQIIQLPDLDDARVTRFADDLPQEIEITSGPLAGFVISSVQQGVSLSRAGQFACAIPGQELVEVNRSSVQTWETFLIVPDEQAGMFRKSAFDINAEMDRFARRVAELNAAGQPVKLYCGSGTVPRAGFLNLDIDVNAPLFLLSNRDEYFIFPFADRLLPIPDNSVDYVFDEDFVEHITQIMQWQFFAETLRVLKPGSYHRVNTPSVIASMKRHSDFSKGFAGVYTGEAEWDHIAILSHFQLKEIAETIGYSDVIFTTRSCGVSPYAERDFRPSSDRDDIGGNIYADMRK